MREKTKKKTTSDRGKKAWANMRRETADKLLAGFLARAAEVNSDASPYSWRVESAYVFGSYLKGSDRPNDLDLAVYLTPRYGSTESDEQRKADDARRQLRTSPSRDMVDTIFWPRAEVRRFLKGGSQRISLHEQDHISWVREQGQPIQLVFGVEYVESRRLGAVGGVIG